jgi:hypothetical protein
MTLAPLQSLIFVQPVEPMISLTAAHVVGGALTLATIVVLTLRTYQVLAPQAAAADSAAANALASSPRKAAV